MSVKSITATRILDAAEALFADLGYDAVSIRAITDKADVRLNLLHYHFGTKEALFEAVIARRMVVLNTCRQDALSKVPAGMGRDIVAEILSAFVRPYLELATSSENGWASYARLIAQISQSNRHLPLLQSHMDETAQLFIDALNAALPQAPRHSVARAFMFTAALMVSVFSGVARIDGLTGGAITGGDLEGAIDPLLAYSLAGFLEICG
ncbi:TetR/AcrR family transcriptional regulator [Agrobacterium vitis]|uniref:TetR/AcrR family transcriptional regulator n=1 Tax=Allorhizobium ampelinum TaxID=3025782 RepID=UPI001F32E2EF|nr:TetR/AcrR family transcriptional regulator [Allorhizobium ampelinum]MCF1470620.1 TetR/AcrR family transcriptional regulator [Allorhizobium ampelinum]